jgi:hypothetical protein
MFNSESRLPQLKQRPKPVIPYQKTFDFEFRQTPKPNKINRKHILPSDLNFMADNTLKDFNKSKHVNLKTLSSFVDTNSKSQNKKGL